MSDKWSSLLAQVGYFFVQISVIKSIFESKYHEKKIMVWYIGLYDVLMLKMVKCKGSSLN